MTKPLLLEWTNKNGTEQVGQFRLDTTGNIDRQIKKHITFVYSVLEAREVREIDLVRFLAKKFTQHKQIHVN